MLVELSTGVMVDYFISFYNFALTYLLNNNVNMTKEEAIIKIAEEEFIQNGYLSTSMVVVAKRAGVTHAMVNYYFRSKEQLFLRILDSHVNRFLGSLKSVMHEGNDFVQTMVNAAEVLFDALDADRDFPFMIQDVIRNSPELLGRYGETVPESIKDSVSRHATRLKKQVEAGKIVAHDIKEILETIISLVVSPFLMIPALENVCEYDDRMIEDYLKRRRQETIELIKARYSR